MGKNPVIKMNKLIKSKENLFFVLCCLFFAIYWLFLIRPAWLGQLGGTFKPQEVPQDYIVLKDFLISQEKFFRTLWLPMRQRFGFDSNLHPSVSGQMFISDNKCLAPFCELKVEKYNREYFKCHPNEHCFPADFSFLANPDTPEVLSRLSIKYIIVPYDSQKKIFMDDRKYNEQARQQLIDFIESLEVYKEVKGFGRIVVFETVDFKDRFWMEKVGPVKEGSTLRPIYPASRGGSDLNGIDQGSTLKWKMINPTKYEVEVKNIDAPFTLIFSESFDKNWIAKWEKRNMTPSESKYVPQGGTKYSGNKEEINRNTVEIEKIYSQKTEDGLNSFAVSEYNNGKIEIEFELQKYVNYGMIISGVTLVGVMVLLLKYR